jgi:hypothetical protein
MPLRLMIGLFVYLFTLPGLAGELRTWTGNNGVKVQAELIEVRGESVVLRPADGRPDTVTPMDRLSKTDQLYVLNHSLKPEPAAKPAEGVVADDPWSAARQRWEAILKGHALPVLVLAGIAIAVTAILIQVWALMVAARTMGITTTMGGSFLVWVLRIVIWIPAVVLLAFMNTDWLESRSWLPTLAAWIFDSLVIGLLYRRGFLTGIAVNVISSVLTGVIMFVILGGIALLMPSAT